MITLIVLFMAIGLIVAIFAIIAGIISIAPAVLLLALLPVIDYLVIKMIFGKKKKCKKEKES